MNEERRIQLVAEVDTTRTRAGFNEIVQQADGMATEVTRAGDQAQRSVASIGSGAGRSAQSVDAAQRNIIGSIQRTTAAMQAGSRSGAEYYEVLARQRGVDPAVLAPYLAQLRAVEAAQRNAGMSTAAYTAALRNVPAQITDIVTGLQGGMPIMTIAIQQGGQLRDMFGGIGAASRALGTQLLGMINPVTITGAAVAALSLAYYQGSKESDAYARSIILTGNAAGTATTQLTAMAREVKKAVGTQGEAAEALAALVGTGDVGAENLQRFATVSVAAQHAIGLAVADTAKEFSDLAKSPLQASEKLSEQYRYLTGAIYTQIKALLDRGQTEAAAEVAQNAYADALATRADKMTDRLGIVEKAWLGVKGAAKGAWDSMLDVGREDTPEARLATVQEKIAKANTPGASSLRTRDARADLAGNLVLERLLQGQIKLINEQATAEGQVNKQREAGLEWAKQITSNLSRQDQLRNELAANQQRGTAAGASSKEISAQATLIRKKYSDIFNDGINSQIEGIKRRGDIEDVVAKRSLDLLTSNHAAGLVSEEAYTKGVAQYELASFARQKTLLQQELALTAGKQNSQKDQAALRGEIDKQDQLATSRQLQLTNDLNAQRENGERDVRKQIQESVLQRAQLLASLQVEYSLYGKTTDARDLAMVSVKSEAELQKKIADAIAAKKPLSDEHIAQLRTEKGMLDEVTQSVMAQSKALGYATQLAQDNKRFAAESLADPKARAEALLAIDADTWRERIKLAGEGTAAQRLLQTEFDTWYGNQQRKLGTEVDLARATALVNILQAVNDAARQAAQGMSDSFGSVGKAIGDLTTSLTGFQLAQATVAAQLAASIQNANGDPVKIAQAQRLAAQQGAQAQIKSYGDMASAAKGFFSENSKGYKTIQAAERAYRAMEMALAVQSMAQKLFGIGAVTAATVAGETAKTSAVMTGTAAQVAADTVKGTSAAAVAVATQAQGDPYSAWPRMAAMAAAMAALGFIVFGGKGSGGGESAADVQKAQGTGSVFGDSSAKSDSIRRSIEQLTANSSDMLPINQGMLTALQNIESSMTGLTNLVVRTTGLTDGANMGIQTGTIATGGPVALAGSAQVGSMIGGALAGPLGVWIGGAIGGAVSKLWGKTTQNIVDSGLQYGGSVRSLQQGQGFDQYASIDTTKSSFFGLSKSTSNRVEVQGLNDELSKQFGLIFTNLDKSLQAAATAMGGSAGDVTKVLDNLTLESTKVSLKGLTGTALTDALNSVISKSMDEIAQAAFPQFDQFRQVGEGYAETVMRIAGDYAKLDSILAASSTTFGATGMASIAARERLIELAGGIDQLASQTNSFTSNFLSKAEQLAPVQKYVTDQLAAMGLQSLDTRDKFKDYVLGLADSGALATEAGAKQYTALLALADAFAKTHAATVDLTKTQQEIADEYTDLQNKLDDLTMTQEQRAEKARNAIDAHNRALYDQVQAAQAAKDALDVQAQLYDVTGNKAAAAALLEKQHADAISGMAPVLAAATLALWNAQAAAAATKNVLGAVSDAYAALQAAVTKEKDKLNEAYTASSDALQLGIDAATASVTKLTSLSQDLRSALDAMAVPGQEKADRAAAQAQIEAALAIAKAGGPLPAADSLKNALSTVSKDASGQFSSYIDYMRDLYRTRNSVGELSGLTDSQLSAEQLTLKTLQAQKTALDAAHKEDLAALDKTLEETKNQTDLLNGIYTSLMTLPQALAALGSAVKAAQADPGVGATSGIAAAYQLLLGRAPDAAGLAFWQSQAASGASMEAIYNSIKSGSEYKSLHPFAVGTNYIPGDMPAMVHEGERIIPAADNRELMSRLSSPSSNADLVAELRALRQQVANLENSGARTANACETGTGLWKRVIRNDRVYASTKEEATTA